MKISDLIKYGAVLLTGTLLFCGDSSKPTEEEEEDDNPVSDYSLIGTWETVIPGKPYDGYPDPITVGFQLFGTDTIDSTVDSTFSLYAIQHPDKDLYMRTGTWLLNGTNLVFTGTNCMMIDINETTFEFKPVSDSIKNIVISIDTTNKVDSLWNNIPLKDLGAIVFSFPIYKTFYKWCESLLPNFEKKISY